MEYICADDPELTSSSDDNSLELKCSKEGKLRINVYEALLCFTNKKSASEINSYGFESVDCHMENYKWCNFKKNYTYAVNNHIQKNYEINSMGEGKHLTTRISIDYLKTYFFYVHVDVMKYYSHLYPYPFSLSIRFTCL